MEVRRLAVGGVKVGSMQREREGAVGLVQRQTTGEENEQRGSDWYGLVKR